ncbi:phage tail spike protein [Nosocomiicoccus sp. HMSC059G07]|uniref:phage tail spike protein n=1 Tax=Nosocomiicoccus sp. HMSC059G07 TaxID=1739531 RepID=UPI0008A55540|nr:phage tail spike protein [Nosocomiicoccus sp. HMSC059G07]OFO55669.1 hypothetical protein HMPREF3029_03590 [Nosocomiicoccus sp. HMSC059G07]
MLTIRDHKNNEYPLLAVKTVNEELNGNHDIELKVPQQRNNKLDLKLIDKLWEINYKTVDYKIIYIKQITKGDSFYLDIRATPLFYFDMDKQIIHEDKDGHYTGKNAFDVVFQDSGYQYVLVDIVNAIKIEGFGKGETRLEMFKRLIDRFSLEFYIVGKTVYLKKLIGNDTNFMYKYKLNASNVSKSIDASGFVTHIKGFGNFENESSENSESDAADNDDYFTNAKLRREYTSPLAEVIGVYEGKPIVDGRVTDKETMNKMMTEAVEKSLEISIEGNLHDVRSIYKEAVPLIGDRVFLIDERINLEQEIRIQSLKQTFDVNDKLVNCEVTFGSESIRSRYKSNLQSVAKDFNSLLKGEMKLPLWSLDEVARGMITKIHASENELRYGDFGMQAISKTNPNHILGVNSAGLYLSEDGGRTARLAMTAEGIAADTITTGTLRAITVDGVEIYGSNIEGTEIRGGKIYGTEIFGSTITGGTIYTDADNDHYISLKGSELISRGIQTRKWFGTTSNDHIRAMIYDGQFRVRNDDKKWSAYFSDMGISTHWDGSGEYIKEGVSGALELHSRRYSDGDYSGMTLYSDGRLALETSGGRIYLNPKGAHVHVADSNNNYYGISASTFSQSSERELKRDIKDYDGNASAIIKDLSIREYKRLTGGEETVFDQWQIGLIVDEAPREVLANGSSIDIYSYVNVIAKSIQEMLPRLEKLEEMSV